MSVEVRVGEGRSVPVEVLPTGDGMLQAVIQSKIDSMKDDEESQDSFFVADVGRVRELFDLWKDVFPSVLPFYSVKCNSDPVLLKVLSSLGVGFDCASKEEIQAVLDVGVSSDRVVFNSSFKFISDIKYAARVGVKVTTVDCDQELLKVKEHYPSADLMIRLCPESYDDYAEHKIEGLRYKFGCTIDVAKHLVQKAKSLDLNVTGVCFHLGIGLDGVSASSISSYLATLKVAEELMSYGEELGFEITMLDIGGGFPGLPVLRDSFRELGAQLSKAVDEVKMKHPSLQRVIAEPGRFFCCSVYTLAACVICTKVAEDGTVAYVLSDGKYHTFSMLRCCPLHPIHPVPLNKERKLSREECKNVHFWGPACAADSILKSNTSLVPELKSGDWLFFENMGAYTMTTWVPFHLRAKPKVHYFISASERKYMTSLLE